MQYIGWKCTSLCFIKNESSSIYLYNNYGTPWLRDSVTLWFRNFSFFLSSTFVYELILLKISMNANIVKLQLLLKIHFFFCLCYWLIEETNAAEHYERTEFDLYNNNICLVFTWTYVLMDNFLSLFLLRIRIRPQVETNDTLVGNLFWVELVYCSVGSEAWTYLPVLSTNHQ